MRLVYLLNMLLNKDIIIIIIIIIIWLTNAYVGCSRNTQKDFIECFLLQQG